MAGVEKASAAPAAGAQASNPLVELTVRDHIATLTLANPERRNVLDLAMATALREAAEAVDRDPEVRCAILTGSGGVFAAGADVNEIQDAGTEENLSYNRLLRAAVDAVAALAVPSIAAVNGHAIGGGLELALACTLRVAAERAKLGMPEARLGIIPATGGLARLPRLIPRSTAARLLLTGDLVDGGEAEGLGMVDYAVPAEAVGEEALALAARIASAARLLGSADRREGARAFLERREPKFSGS